MMSLDDFRYHSQKIDFQRNNLFSVIFTSAPGSNRQKTESFITKVDSFGNTIANNVGGTLGGAISTASAYASQYADNLIGRFNQSTLGALNNRVVETVAGSFGIGGLMDLAAADFKMAGLLAYNAQIPEVRINTEMERFHSSPGIKIMQRDLDPLVIAFRMDSKGQTYKTMLEWNYAVEDPVTGLRALPQDVSGDIQIVLYDRNMKSKTIYAFKEIIPVSITAPELSYESDNEIASFNVTFVYRNMSIVDVPAEKAEKFAADVVGNVVDYGKGALGF